MSYDYSIDTIRVLRDHAILERMLAPEAFHSASLETLQACYNGVGPEQWSSRFRKLTTWLLNRLEASALIHDWEYTYSPKTYSAFTAANARLGINAYKDCRRWTVALLAFLLCQLFGWKGYKSGGSK